MNEAKKPGKREWVKTAVIIFLAVLLVLTFFSNTIMNANLPEVAVQYVTSGTISAQIRGQATVTASASFDVIMPSSRRVKTVYAKVGRTVEAGDVLFVLAAGDSEEIEVARQELESAEATLQTLQNSLEDQRRSYQRALLQAASDADYTKENRNIKKLSDEIKEKTEERDAIDFSDDALKEAKAALDEAEAEVKKQEAAVAEAEKTVKEAKDAAKEAADTLDAAEGAYLEQKEKVEALEAERTSLENQGEGGSADVEKVLQAWEAAKKAVEDEKVYLEYAEGELEKAREALELAQEALEEAHSLYDEGNARVYAKAMEMIIADYEAEHGEGSFETDFPEQADKDAYFLEKFPDYDNAAAELLKETDPEASDAYYALNDAKKAVKDAENAVSGAERIVENSKNAVLQAEQKEKKAKEAYEAACSGINKQIIEEKNKLETLETAYKAAQKDKAAKDKAVEKAQEDVDNITSGALADANAAKEKAQTVYDAAKADLDEKKTRYDTLNSEISSLEEQLEEAVFQLAEQKKSDELTKKLQNLDFEAQRSEISRTEKDVAKAKEKVAEAQDNLDKLTTGAKETGLELTADVNGVIKAVNVTAGNTPSKGDIVATIEVPDRGYTAEMTVTSEQAQRVSVGEYAQVSMGWWGRSDIQAQLVSMRADPQNPQGGRILIFEVTGSDVESGATLNLAIGERSRSFDTIIPKSAIRSDTNGEFVLMITAKQTPLSTRYIASRVAITKIAEDDTMVAVSGELAYNDCVITTASGPISSGMQVRLADEG